MMTRTSMPLITLSILMKEGLLTTPHEKTPKISKSALRDTGDHIRDT